MKRTHARSLLIMMIVLTLVFIFSPTLLAQQKQLPNQVHIANPNGVGATYTTDPGGQIDLTGPFFQSLGTNGRSCGTCHQPSDGMSVSAAHIEQRFLQTEGKDPIFR